MADQETVILTEELAEQYPGLKSKGWNVGEKIPQSIIDEEAGKEESAADNDDAEDKDEENAG